MTTLHTSDADVQVDDKTGQHYTTTPEEGADYIGLTEFIRRRHKLDLEKDQDAKPIYDRSIRMVIKRGEIIMYKQGIHFFINWNKYKNFAFAKYRQRKSFK